MYDEQELKQFDRWKVKRPEHIEHGLSDTVENPLSKQLPKLRCWNWRRDENGMLTCDTEHGPLSQTLSPQYLVLGDGPDGGPALKKLDC